MIWLTVVFWLMAARPAYADVLSGPGGNAPSLTISAPNPPQGPEGTRVVLAGSHWTPSASFDFAYSTAGGACDASETRFSGVTATADNQGQYQVALQWPATLPGTYAICALGVGTPLYGTAAANVFTKLGQGAPSISVVGTATIGLPVTINGANWFTTQAGSANQVEVLSGDPSGNGCTTHQLTLTPAADGTITGTFTPSATGPLRLTAVNPPGTCNGATQPSLSTSIVIIVMPTSSGGAGTPGAGGAGTPGAGGAGTPGAGGAGTPGAGGAGTPGAGGAGTPGAGGAGTPGTGTPGAGGAGTPGAGGAGTPGASRPTATPCATTNCRPAPVSGIPFGPLCLALLVLFALLLLLFLLLIRRRNEEIIVTEEDVTAQIDPASVAPLGAMRFVKTVRVTTQVADRRTGMVRRSRSRDFDEFADTSGVIRRRLRTTTS